jgi:hypothetical protein
MGVKGNRMRRHASFLWTRGNRGAGAITGALHWGCIREPPGGYSCSPGSCMGLYGASGPAGHGRVPALGLARVAGRSSGGQLIKDDGGCHGAVAGGGGGSAGRGGLVGGTCGARQRIMRSIDLSNEGCTAARAARPKRWDKLQFWALGTHGGRGGCSGASHPAGRPWAAAAASAR